MLSHNSKSFTDLLGQEFGRLTVLELCPPAPTPRTKSSTSRQWRARCRCSCGTEIVSILEYLRRGFKKSCGCLQRELYTPHKGYVHHRRVHGEGTKGEETDEYRAWKAMKNRCSPDSARYFSRYAGRGISVCDRWQNSYSAFLQDMGRRPSAEHSLDRKDNNGNYEPGNCRWATKEEQNNNTRANRILTVNGVSRTQAQWARETGVSERVIALRLKKGMSVEDAIKK
jgi:hypothetical protein